MTHQAPPSAAPSDADPARQIAQLRELLGLVRAIAGRPQSETERDSILDEAARVSGAYERALPVVRRRFDALSGETSGWAAAGVEALLAAGDDVQPQAAAARLATQLDRALAEMAALLD